MDFRGVILAFLSTVVLIKAMPNRPFYIDCISSNECSKDECCVIGMGRFSMPSCRPHQEVGEVCRPFNSPARTNVSYPDGTVVTLDSVYYSLCPCGLGSSCNEDTASCEDITFNENYNGLDY